MARPPTLFSAGLAREICRRIAAGEALRAICAGDGMPAAQTVGRWRRTRPGFARRYAAALPRPRRRRVRLTAALLQEICRRLAGGEFLVAICRDPHMPARQTVHQRLRTDEAFRARYGEARALQVEHLFEEIVTIADHDDNPTRAKLRIETRKWLVGKLDPKRYGDRVGRSDGTGGVATLIVDRLEKGRPASDDSR